MLLTLILLIANANDMDSFDDMLIPYISSPSTIYVDFQRMKQTNGNPPKWAQLWFDGNNFIDK